MCIHTHMYTHIPKVYSFPLLARNAEIEKQKKNAIFLAQDRNFPSSLTWFQDAKENHPRFS